MRYLIKVVIFTFAFMMSYKTYDKPNIPSYFRKVVTTKLVCKATVYNAEKGQTDSRPFETASGSIIDNKKVLSGEMKWIAVSRDLLESKKLSFDDTVYVKELNDFYVVKDKLGSFCGKGKKRRKIKNQIDFLTHKSQNQKMVNIFHRYDYQLTFLKTETYITKI